MSWHDEGTVVIETHSEKWIEVVEYTVEGNDYHHKSLELITWWLSIHCGLIKGKDITCMNYCLGKLPSWWNCT